MHREVIGPRPRTRVGRRRYWQSHLSAQAGSGLSQAEYCRRHGLSKSSFGWWKRKLQQIDAGSASLSLVPVGVISSPGRLSAHRSPQAFSGLVLVVAGGTRVEIGVDFHGPTLERVLRVMERLP